MPCLKCGFVFAIPDYPEQCPKCREVRPFAQEKMEREKIRFKAEIAKRRGEQCA